MNYIEFIKLGKSEVEKSSFAGDINLGTVKHEVGVRRFSGKVNVYNSKLLIWSLNAIDGQFSGDYVKYTDYMPSSFTGYLAGYVTFNWRQPEIMTRYRNGLLDGPVTIYRKDGSKEFLLNYSMGLLEGEQKHYITTSARVLHRYSKGVWKESSKQLKNWFGTVEIDEVSSHRELKARVKTLV